MWIVFPRMHRAPPGTIPQPSQSFLQGSGHQFVQHDLKMIKPLILNGLFVNSGVPGHGAAAQQLAETWHSSCPAAGKFLGTLPAPLGWCPPGHT